MQARQRSPLLRADQVAEIIGVSPRIAAELMQQMPRVNVGRSLLRPRWAVAESDVYAFIDSRKQPPEAIQPQKRRKKPDNIVSLSGLIDERGRIARRK